MSFLGVNALSLDAKYDEFYEADSTRDPLRDIELPAWPKDRVQALMALNLRGKTLLDVGCGDGRVLFQFRQRFDTLIGVEFSAARLKVAERNLMGLNFRPVCSSAEAMVSVPTGSVDCIVSADVIEHIPDVYAATDELFRVLRPGGVLAINTPNIAFIVKRWRLLAGRFPSTSQPNEGLGSDVLFDGGHLHYFTYRSLALLLERSGFVVDRRIGFGAWGRIHNFMPSLLSVGVQLVAHRPV